VIDLLFNIDVLFVMDIRDGKNAPCYLNYIHRKLRKAIIIVKNSLHQRYICEVTHIAIESEILSLNLFTFVKFPTAIYLIWLLVYNEAIFILSCISPQ